MSSRLSLVSYRRWRSPSPQPQISTTSGPSQRVAADSDGLPTTSDLTPILSQLFCCLDCLYTNHLFPHSFLHRPIALTPPTTLLRRRCQFTYTPYPLQPPCSASSGTGRVNSGRWLPIPFPYLRTVDGMSPLYIQAHDIHHTHQHAHLSIVINKCLCHCCGVTFVQNFMFTLVQLSYIFTAHSM